MWHAAVWHSATVIWSTVESMHIIINRVKENLHVSGYNCMYYTPLYRCNSLDEYKDRNAKAMGLVKKEVYDDEHHA